MATIVLEQCNIESPPDAPVEQSFPLLHFDMIWFRSHLIHNLLFYDFPCSTSHFLEIIAPNLKTSLSSTLKHFLPLAGKVLFPLTSSGRPVCQYVSGDSLTLTVAQSRADFIHLTGNHQRNVDEFYKFVPRLPEADCSPDFIKIRTVAIQVTLFPNQGICIGCTNHHVIADGATFVGFVHSWASIMKHNGDAHLVASRDKYLPSYDRTGVQDPNGLDATRWNKVKFIRPTLTSTLTFPTNKVRGTFVLSETNIEKLKNLVAKERPSMGPISSFVVVTAYIAACLAKSAEPDDEPEYLACVADCRARLNPPLPITYFGNCLALVKAELNQGKLKGGNGFLDSAQALGEAIKATLDSGKGILDDSENRLRELRKMAGKRVIGVSGSPRFDLYGADFGWGRPKKYEALHIDCDRSISLCKSRDFNGGVEIGMSMTKVKMDLFAAIFNEGIGEATQTYVVE